MFLGFYGIYLIAVDKPIDGKPNENYVFGVTCNVVASLFMAIGYICLRKINISNSPLYSPFYFFCGAISLALIMMVYSPEYIPKVHTYTFPQILLFLGGQ